MPSPSILASLSLHRTDRIRLMDFPKSMLQFLGAVIRNHWAQGVQDTRWYGGSFEIKLNGNPWVGRGKEAITSRRLMQNILHALHARGWVLILSTDISKKIGDKDTLVFRLQAREPAPCTWMCIAFSGGDRLRFVDAPADYVRAVVPMVSPWTQKVVGETDPQCFDIKLNGYPWFAEGEAAMSARRLILVLIKGLEQQGFRIYTSIDQKIGDSEANRGEMDTWYCCRPVDRSPAMVITQDAGEKVM